MKRGNRQPFPSPPQILWIWGGCPPAPQRGGGRMGREGRGRARNVPQKPALLRSPLQTTHRLCILDQHHRRTWLPARGSRAGDRSRGGSGSRPPSAAQRWRPLLFYFPMVEVNLSGDDDQSYDQTDESQQSRKAQVFPGQRNRLRVQPGRQPGLDQTVHCDVKHRHQQSKSHV